MSACFCASVIPNTLRFSGLLSGVCVSSSPDFVGTTAVMFSLDDVDALADAICFCFRGGMIGVCVCGIRCCVKYEGELSRSIVQLSGERVTLQLWWCIFDICLDGSGCLFMLERASSFALALHWRSVGVTAESAAGCTRAASPSANQQLTATALPSSPPPTTSYHCITASSRPLPPHQHLLTYRQEPTLITHLSTHTQHRQHGSRGHHDCVRAPISRSSNRAEDILVQDTVTDNITVWTTPNLLVTATTCPHAGRRKPMPPTSSSTARPKQTPSQALVL